MPTFEQGDIVKVPFPYTNRPTPQSRPALVVSTGCGNDALSLLWVVTVTSAENRGWPGDVSLADLAGTGLPAPSPEFPRRLFSGEIDPETVVFPRYCPWPPFGPGQRGSCLLPLPQNSEAKGKT